MRLAVVTTPPSLPSGIGDYTRHLLAELRTRAEVTVFVQDGREGESLDGLPTHAARALRPREFDRIVYQLGNEVAHAFMEPMVRRLGGTVVLHDWVLFDLALAAHPALARGGLKGHVLAWREGGAAAARVYFDHWRGRRQSLRNEPDAQRIAAMGGTGIEGWHEPEPEGRWTAGRARLTWRLDGRERLRVTCHGEPGRTAVLRTARERTAVQFREGASEQVVELAVDGRGAIELDIEVTPLIPTRAQRQNGDTRELGIFVRAIEAVGGAGSASFDLSSAASSIPVAPTWTLSRERFRLALNRGIVRFADSFLVHSRFVGERVREDRNAPTPIGVLQHGAAMRWRDEDRRLARDRLGLPEAWRSAVLFTCFGGVQAHKRIEPLLEAFAAARRERVDLRLALIGAIDREFDAFEPLRRRLALGDALRCTGRVDERIAWEWLHAGDLAVQLRGPSTGGSSGGVFQSLAAGRGVVVSDSDEQRELPDDAVLRVRADADEIPRLRDALLALAADGERRTAMEQAARRFVSEECAWPRIAERYVELLAGFPRARASRVPIWRATT